MTRPQLLDLFSGAGGAAVGYHRAGFNVVGVDITPQPRYPFEHHVADALTFPLDGFDAVHSSPPCHDHSALSSMAGKDGTAWMLAATRARLADLTVPWVIENVPGAPMRYPLVLCGTEFGLYVHTRPLGVRRWLKRHRLFESNISLWGAGGCYCARKLIGGVYGHGGGGSGRRGWQLYADEARGILDVPWMTRDEANLCVPPAYTEHIGAQLLDHIRAGATA